MIWFGCILPWAMEDNWWYPQLIELALDISSRQENISRLSGTFLMYNALIFLTRLYHIYRKCIPASVFPNNVCWNNFHRWVWYYNSPFAIPSFDSLRVTWWHTCRNFIFFSSWLPQWIQTIVTFFLLHSINDQRIRWHCQLQLCKEMHPCSI